jgi:hypothetical protein
MPADATNVLGGSTIKQGSPIFAVMPVAMVISVEFAQAKHIRHVHKHARSTRLVQKNASRCAFRASR